MDNIELTLEEHTVSIDMDSILYQRWTILARALELVSKKTSGMCLRFEIDEHLGRLRVKCMEVLNEQYGPYNRC